MVHVLAIALVTTIKRSVVEVEQHGNAGRSMFTNVYKQLNNQRSSIKNNFKNYVFTSFVCKYESSSD